MTDATEHWTIESIGLYLKTAREQNRQETVEQVAEALRLPKRVIHALEASEFEQAPGLTFMRGYLLAYAKYLELALEPISDLFSKAYPRAEERNLTAAATSSVPHLSVPRGQKRSFRWGMWGVWAFVLVGVLLWWHDHKITTRISHAATALPALQGVPLTLSTEKQPDLTASKENAPKIEPVSDKPAEHTTALDIFS